MNDSKHSGTHITLAWVLAVCTFGYMLPWAVGASRGKSNAGAIGLVNLFAGWTIVGWFVALVMACGSHQQVAAPVVVQVAAPPAEPAQSW